MPPTPRSQPIPQSRQSDSRYPIIFAVLGAVILVGGVMYGYFLPKWRKRSGRSVQTRHNCFGAGNCQTQLHHDLELPVIFPPHPAVVVPLNRRSKLHAQGRVRYPSYVPVYDPRTQSPFPSTPKPGSCRPTTSNDSITKRNAVPTSKSRKVYDARLQHTQSNKSWCPGFETAWPASRCTSTGHKKPGYTRYDSMNKGACPFLVARSAGAPPVKPKKTRLAAEKLRCPPLGKKIPAMFSDFTFPAVNALDHPILPRRSPKREVNSKLYPRTAVLSDRMKKEETTKEQEKPMRTPCQAGFGFENVFETPSSPGTVTTTQFGSSGTRAHCDSTPPTGPNSSAIQPQGWVDPYPGISKLVPSRRFKGYIASTDIRRTPCPEVVSETRSRVSSECAHESKHIVRTGHRPVSGIDVVSTTTIKADDRSSTTEFQETRHDD
jgi:hypothetical protein